VQMLADRIFAVEILPNELAAHNYLVFEIQPESHNVAKFTQDEVEEKSAVDFDRDRRTRWWFSRRGISFQRLFFYFRLNLYAAAGKAAAFASGALSTIHSKPTHQNHKRAEN